MRKLRHGEFKWFGGNKSDTLESRQLFCVVCVWWGEVKTEMKIIFASKNGLDLNICQS